MRRPGLALLAVSVLAGLSAACDGGRETPLGPPRRGAAPLRPGRSAFEREAAGNVDLYVVPAGGGAARRLTDRSGSGHPAPLSPRTAPASCSPRTARAVRSSGRSRPRAGTRAASGPTRPRSTRPTSRRTGAQLAFLSNLGGPERLLVQTLGSEAARELVRHGEEDDLRQPPLEPGRPLPHLLLELPDRPPDLRGRRGDREGAPDLPARDRRLRAALQPGREQGRLREPGSPGGPRAASSSTTSRPERSGPSSPGRPSTTTRSTRRTAPSSPSPRTSRASTRSTARGSPTGQAWRVTFGPGDARSPDYRPAAGGAGGRQAPRWRPVGPR